MTCLPPGDPAPRVPPSPERTATPAACVSWCGWASCSSCAVPLLRELSPQGQCLAGSLAVRLCAPLLRYWRLVVTCCSLGGVWAPSSLVPLILQFEGAVHMPSAGLAVTHAEALPVTRGHGMSWGWQPLPHMASLG